MHVPDENLPRYRRLMALVRKVERIGNNRSNRGDYAGANAAWSRSSRISTAAQSLRVPGGKEKQLGDQPPTEISSLDAGPGGRSGTLYARRISMPKENNA